MSLPSDADGSEATFHEVVFGEAGGEQQRFGFEDFRALSLRQRVKLLMSMPAQFLSATGTEIPRDAAMRFRQPVAKPEQAAVPDAEDRVGRLIRTLHESSLEHELRGCVKLAETIEIEDVDQRALLAGGLLRTARLFEDEHGSTPTSWAAIRRFGSLVPTTRLAELHTFMQPGTEAETMQAALQSIWNALSVDQDFGLAVLAVRVRQLLTKYLDADWLCSGSNRALTIDLLLAYSVLVPNTEEAGLRKIYARLRQLAEGVVLELARPEILAALAHARAKVKPITARLEQLAEYAG